MTKRMLLVVLGVVVLVAVAVFLFNREISPIGSGKTAHRAQGTEGTPVERVHSATAEVSKHRHDVHARESSEENEDAANGEVPPEMSEDEKREAAEEKLVDAFDAETDRWMDAEKTKQPSMAEVERFRAMFKAIPKDRKEDCLHRALNLIPDENVMLLVGILMDGTEDKELVEIVYNDILNRDEDVKKPILQTIFKDKSHPCWADTAWILDVTDELPKKK